MKQKIYAMLLLLAMTITAQAQEAQWCLVVESAAGETIAIGADLKPVVKTTAEGYELRYGSQTTAFTWSELKKVTVKKTVADHNVTPVEEVKTVEENPSFRIADGEIRISGAEPGTMVLVYAVNGQQVLRSRVGENGSVSLSATGLPANMYIIKTTKSSFKLIKK